MTQLTEDELTCLGICAQGESLAAIGRWEPSVDALVEKGLLVRHDKFNNTITPAGRAALAGETADADQAFRQAVGKAMQVKNSAWEFEAFAQSVALEMVQHAKAAAAVSGYSTYTTLKTWLDQLDAEVFNILARK